MILNKPSTTKVDILGTEWSIQVVPMGKRFEDRSCEAYCDNSIKTVFIGLREHEPDDVDDIICIRKQYVRHELIHAFFYERGLGVNSMSNYCWATNEEMVDWLALQFHKIEKVFKDLKV